MKIRGFLSLGCALTLVFASQLLQPPIATAQNDNRGRSRYVAKLISPRAGDVLYPGDQVTIKWEATLPAVELTWCEVEVYLSLDGGRTNYARLTPQLDPRIGFYNWTVPNLPTTMAVLDIHFGCETVFPESRSVQSRSMFTIASARGVVPEVSMNPVQVSLASPGSTLQVSWNSTVENVESYELQISYDRGAHFQKLAETKELHSAWNVPADFAGHATFRVIAHTAGGGQVESMVSAEPQVRVGSE